MKIFMEFSIAVGKIICIRNVTRTVERSAGLAHPRGDHSHLERGQR